MSTQAAGGADAAAGLLLRASRGCDSGACAVCSTSTAAALVLLRSGAFVAARVGVSRIALFVSNANSEDAVATQDEAAATRRAGVGIMAVAVGTWLDINELRSVVSYPADRNTLQVRGGYDQLDAVVPTVHAAVCGSTCSSHTTRPPARRSTAYRRRRFFVLPTANDKIPPLLSLPLPSFPLPIPSSPLPPVGSRPPKYS